MQTARGRESARSSEELDKMPETLEAKLADRLFSANSGTWVGVEGRPSARVGESRAIKVKHLSTR